MTQPSDYLEQLSSDNAAVLFIDAQTTLTLGVQSIDLTVLKTNTEGLAKLAKMFALPVVLTTTGGGAGGPSGGFARASLTPCPTSSRSTGWAI